MDYTVFAKCLYFALQWGFKWKKYNKRIFVYGIVSYFALLLIDSQIHRGLLFNLSYDKIAV